MVARLKKLSSTACADVLLASTGMRNKDIAAELDVECVQAGRWHERYARSRLAGIECDLPRGTPVCKVDAASGGTDHADGAPQANQRSTHSMANVLGVSQSSVSRHWRAQGLKPHLIETFKVSSDPKFVEKVKDIVGLYMSPPEHALMLCCDEKSQIQALDRTQPGLPLKKGRATTITHDYKRHGTTTLFAALNTLDESIIFRCEQHNRHTEWLEKHPRFTVHFTPASASWLNMVERFFRDITTGRLRCSVFRNVPELNAVIKEFIVMHNQSPRPLVWTAKANDILQKVIRANLHLSAKQNDSLH
jgi:hypothetical protein